MGGLLAAHAKLSAKAANPEVESTEEELAKLQTTQMAGVSEFITILGSAGDSKTFRRLAAIQTASDEDLAKAESNPAFRAELEELQAEKPFGESARAAFGFFGGLMGSLDGSLGSSSGPSEDLKASGSVSPDDTPSANS